MKKKIFISILLIVISFISIGCEKKETNEENLVEVKNENKKELIEAISINNNDKSYSIYYYGINSAFIDLDNEKLELTNAIYRNLITFDELIKDLKVSGILNDGGTTIYKASRTKKYLLDNYTIIKCNTIDGNNDIYIGDENMEYRTNFCKSNNSTFTRTYTVAKIKKNNKTQEENGIPVTYSNSYNVTLKQFQGETQTITINNLSYNIKEKETYEFELMLNNHNSNFEDNINNIFKNTTIVEIRKTNKKGLDQLQESIK